MTLIALCTFGAAVVRPGAVEPTVGRLRKLSHGAWRRDRTVFVGLYRDINSYRPALYLALAHCPSLMRRDEEGHLVLSALSVTVMWRGLFRPVWVDRQHVLAWQWPLTVK